MRWSPATATAWSTWAGTKNKWSSSVTTSGFVAQATIFYTIAGSSPVVLCVLCCGELQIHVPRLFLRTRKKGCATIVEQLKGSDFRRHVYRKFNGRCGRLCGTSGQGSGDAL